MNFCVVMITLFYDNEEDGANGTSGSRLKERPLLHLRISGDEELSHIYDFGTELGRGHFGVVMEARARVTGMRWAVKVISKSQANYRNMKLVEREIKILRLISHPNIIHLEKVFESPKKLYLVFELCTGTLAQEFSERRPFNESDTREVMRKLANAVAYLHRNGIVHRDLKLENILLTANPVDPDDKLFIKVTDFGQSVVRSGVGHDQMLHERCGTMAYMAPEVMESRMYSHQCDVWSMGVITFLLLTGDFPFCADSPEDLKQRVLSEEPHFSNIGHTGTDITDEAKAVVQNMLSKKPEFRITAAELCVHPWLLEDRCSKPRMNVIELMNSLMETGSAHAEDDREYLRRSGGSMVDMVPGRQRTSGPEGGSRRAASSKDSSGRGSEQRRTQLRQTAVDNGTVDHTQALSEANVDTVSGRRSLGRRKTTKVERGRPTRELAPPMHMPLPPPPAAAVPVLSIIDGQRHTRLVPRTPPGTPSVRGRKQTAHFGLQA